MNTMKQAYVFARALLAAAALVFPAPAKALMTNVSVAADTFISDGIGITNYNAGGHIHVSSGTSGAEIDRRGLFRFDLSGIPPGSTIDDATFSLDVVGMPALLAVDSTFDLFRLQAEWGEGTNAGPGGVGGNDGAPATAGEATWNSRQHSVALWTNPGGSGDFLATASASAFVTGLGNYNWTSLALVSNVQIWVDSPSQNHGWILISQSENTIRTARAFGSREGGSPAQLTIMYTPFEIEDISLAGDPVVTFQSSTNLVYGLQYTDDLVSEEWVYLFTNVPGTGGPVALSDTNSAVDRAYRATVAVPDP